MGNMWNADIPVWQYYLTRNNTDNPVPHMASPVAFAPHNTTLRQLNDGVPCMGTCHGFDVPYVFRELQLYDDPLDVRLSTAFTHAWHALAANGDPNTAPYADAFRKWPGFSPILDRQMQMDMELTVTSHVKHLKCDFFDSKAAVDDTQLSLRERFHEALR